MTSDDLTDEELTRLVRLANTAAINADEAARKGSSDAEISVLRAQAAIAEQYVREKMERGKGAGKE
ncbi:hypothetical protein ABZX12_14660 [Kribbella sp. NPDC003505]|uniref:hypothetical protein n=1 Tax=Kribbella sp. NPDC003505 TaxID=3154448 RepID=UPI0033A919F6